MVVLNLTSNHQMPNATISPNDTGASSESVVVTVIAP